MAVFKKKILLPDKYTINGETVDVTPNRIKQWVKNFNRLRRSGYDVPAPYRHDAKAVPMRRPDDDDVDAFNNGGWWQKLWINRSDGSLWGKVEVKDPEKAEKIRNGEIKDVSPSIVPSLETGNGKTIDSETMMHIAMVTHPIAGHQTPFEEEGSIAAAMVFSREFASKYDPDEDGWEFQSLATVTPSASVPQSASDATLNDVLKILKHLGMTLPSDTTDSNLYERMVSAGLALTGQMGTVVEQPAPPVSLSNEDTIMADDSKAATKSATKPVEEAQLSEADQAALNFAQKTATDVYKRRIDDLVNSGRVPPKMVEQHVAPLLSSIRLEFSADGTPSAGVLDTILSCLEAVPENSCMVSRRDIQQHGHMFSMSTAVTEESPPEDYWRDEDLGTEEDADKLIDNVPAWKTRVR